MISGASFNSGMLQRVRAWAWRTFVEGRQAFVNKLFSALYGVPMQVMPKGHVGLAGAVVLWYMQDGMRQYIMVRNVKDGDGKVRFISCLGVGKLPDMGASLRTVAKSQLGDVFARVVTGKVLDADRIASAPLFSYTDENVGVAMPVQSLVWCVQVDPALVDLIVSAEGMQAVMVPEFAMTSVKVSPTHKALWESVQRHLPKLRKAEVTAPEAVEDAIRDIGAGGRIVH